MALSTLGGDFRQDSILAIEVVNVEIDARPVNIVVNYIVILQQHGKYEQIVLYRHVNARVHSCP